MPPRQAMPAIYVGRVSKTMHETRRLAFDGAVDADGHILEPPDLWETYLEPQYRDRALRFVRDENGLEELEIGGQRSRMSRKGFPSTLGAMGDPDLRAMQLDPDRTYLGEAPLGHPDNDAVFAAAQDLDVPFAIHPTFEPQWTKGGRFGTWENVKQLRLLASVTASNGVREQFTTLFDYGVFDKFPRLKVIVLESGGGWIGYWLDRIDAVYGHTFIGPRVPLEHKPSDYFRERVWISCDPDERSSPALPERFGERFLCASDFPHADRTPA